jgi:hypothetical protein
LILLSNPNVDVLKVDVLKVDLFKVDVLGARRQTSINERERERERSASPIQNNGNDASALANK